MTDLPQRHILIVSNTGLSNETSNGRTLANLLKDFSPELLAQFYIHGTLNTNACKSSFHVSDKAAVNAFLMRKSKIPASQVSSAPDSSHRTQSTDKAELSACTNTSTASILRSDTALNTDTGENTKKVQRSCKNLVLRDIIWRSNRWWNKDFKRFLDEFQPEVVLLQAGDSPFMYAIARKIAKKYQAKLTMFNTENYVLKKKLFAGAKQKDIWHWILRHRLRVQYRGFMKKADYCVYNTQWLEDAYQKAYPHPGKSCTLYVSSELSPKDCASKESFDVTYCGNLGVGRTAPLMQFSKVLHEAIPEATLHIYGKFQSQKEQAAFLQLPNVIVHGVIPYVQVPETLASSTMVLHCENPKRVENLKYAFSTKIADCLACGRPFLVYASQEYPFVRYLAEHDCAHIASTPEQLAELLAKCRDRDYCDKPLQNAQTLALENHATDVNSQRMHSILCSL